MIVSQGWHDDAFALSGTVYMPDRIVTVKENKRVVDEALAMKLWLTYTDQLSNLPAHALTVLMSFAAPLASLAGIGGLTASPFSRGTYGKLALARFAVSVWSSPEEAISPEATVGERIKRYGRAGSLPVLHLGAMAMRPAEVDATIAEYSLCSATTSTRDMPSVYRSWGGILIMPITKEMTRGMQAFDYPLPFTDFPRAELEAFAEQHHGIVGQRYVHFLVNNLPAVRNLLTEAEARMKAHTGIHDYNRYLIALLACLSVSASITHMLKLIPFNPARVLTLATQRAIELDKILSVNVRKKKRDKMRADYESKRRKR